MPYKNPETYKKYQKQYKEKNKEKIQDLNKKGAKARSEYLKKQKLCVNCGKNPQLENFTQCENCKNRQKKLLKIRTQKGLCGRCGKPKVEGKFFCQDCLNKDCEKRKRKKEAGICYSCKNVAVENRSKCAECFMKAMAKQAGTTAEILKDIWNEQNGICTYSGRKLIIGINASVDHKMPKSKGGNNDSSNLQFVHKTVNFAKNNLLENDFIQLINDCYDYGFLNNNSTALNEDLASAFKSLGLPLYGINL